MGWDLARTFVSFSSTDYDYYTLMTAWKGNENIAFNFAHFQLDDAIKSQNEYYIKSVCAAKIRPRRHVRPPHRQRHLPEG